MLATYSGKHKINGLASIRLFVSSVSILIVHATRPAYILARQ